MHPQGTRCFGNLQHAGSTYQCETCSATYPTVNGIPVLMDEQGQANEAALAFYQNYIHARATDLAGHFQYVQDSGFQQSTLADIHRWIDELKLAGPSLEIGCAGGVFAEVLPEYTGLEFSLQSLLVPGFEFARTVNADAAVLPFPNDHFELILSVNTLEHVPRVDQAFAEMDRVLGPGGLLYLLPAWNCTRYNTELIPIRPYRELGLRQKLVKFLLPIIRSAPYKAATRIPARAIRRYLRNWNGNFRWRPLTPNYASEQLTDQDACASIDPHDAICHFRARGYECLSHRGTVQQLTTRSAPVILRKCRRSM